MIWLGLQFNTQGMTIMIPPKKLTKIVSIVADWLGCKYTNVHDLRALLGKLFFVSQCCLLAHCFLNGMLETLRSCPAAGEIPFSPNFQNDHNWFACNFPTTTSIYIIHDQTRAPVILYVDACTWGLKPAEARRPIMLSSPAVS